jgi:nucleotide-binding universal stress UspA family protein
MGEPQHAMVAHFEVQEVAQAYLGRIATELRSAGHSVEYQVLSGSSAEAILSYARDRQADLIVMSTHGRSGIGRWVFGSVADKVLRGAHIPVFLVRASANNAPAEVTAYQRILVPLDGSPLAEQALPHAEKIARAFHGEIVVLRVPTIPPSLTFGPDPGVLLPTLLNEAYDEADAYLDNVVRRLHAHGIVAHKVPMDPGPVAEAILDYARDADIDLIVMSTHGRSGIGRWVYGSVADRVLRGAEVPVLLIRARNANRQGMV